MGRTSLLLILLCIAQFGCNSDDKGETTQLPHLEWLPQNDNVTLGAILVPEDHQNPQGKKIQLTYLVIKAREGVSDKYPVIYFMGGPGGNTIFEDEVNFYLNWEVRRQHDIVLFDQRGTGLSTPLPNMSMESFDIMAMDADEEKELELTENLIKKYKERCNKMGLSPRFYNSTQSAQDVGMLFKHLGYKKYNIMGHSYGTRLGRVVQDLYPEYVHSSILAAPAPRTVDFLFDRLDSYSLAFQRLLENCKRDSLCNEAYPNLKEDYINSIKGLKKKSLKVRMGDSLDVTINAQDGLYLLRRLMYSTKSRELVPKLVNAFLNRDEAPILNQIIGMEIQNAQALNLSMLLSVEKFENFNPSNTKRLIDRHYTSSDFFPARMGFFDAIYQAGMEWHQGNLPIADREFHMSDIPTLIMVNQFDPVTPPEYGRMFKKMLSNCTLLILDEGGHGSGNRACRDKVMMDFMSSPYKDLDTSCFSIYTN